MPHSVNRSRHSTRISSPYGVSRRRFLTSGVAAGAGLALSPTLLAALTRTRQPGEPILPWTEIAPGIHGLVDATVEDAGSSGGNVLAIVGGGEALVVDSKFPYLGAAIRADAEALAGGSVTLANTHHHADHTGGNAAFKGIGRSRDGVPVLAHRNAFNRIRKQYDRYLGAAQGAVQSANSYDNENERLADLATQTAEQAELMKAGDFTPSLRLGEEGTIELGDTTVAYAHHGNGHTDNDLVFNIDSGRVIQTGDLVFNGVFPFFDQAAKATARGWINSLNAILAECNPDTIVIPGHGPAGDRAIVEAQRDYFEQLIEAVQTEIDNGTPKDEVTTKTWDFMEGFGFENLRPTSIGGVYDELNG